MADLTPPFRPVSIDPVHIKIKYVLGTRAHRTSICDTLIPGEKSFLL